MTRRKQDDPKKKDDLEKTGWPGENHRPVTSHWQTLSHNVVHLDLAVIELTTSMMRICEWVSEWVSEGYLTSSRVTIMLRHGDDDDSFVVELHAYMDLVSATYVANWHNSPWVVKTSITRRYNT
jgi:hypothetical protein